MSAPDVEWSVMVKEFMSSSKKVEKVKLVRLKWKNSKGNFSPVEIPNSEFIVKTDLVILAMGFLHVKHSKLLSDLGIDYSEKGNIAVKENYMTSVSGIYAAGDSHTGASLIVKAIYHGRKAANCINRNIY